MAWQTAIKRYKIATLSALSIALLCIIQTHWETRTQFTWHGDYSTLVCNISYIISSLLRAFASMSCSSHWAIGSPFGGPERNTHRSIVCSSTHTKHIEICSFLAWKVIFKSCNNKTNRLYFWFLNENQRNKVENKNVMMRSFLFCVFFFSLSI